MHIHSILWRDSFIRSMLPESDRRANLLALALGVLSFAISFWFATFKNKVLTPRLDWDPVRKEIVVTGPLPTMTVPPKVVPKPPKPVAQKTKTTEKPKSTEVAAQSESKASTQSKAAGSLGGSGANVGRGTQTKSSRGVLAVLSAMTTKYTAAASLQMTSLRDVNELSNKMVGMVRSGKSDYQGRRGSEGASLWQGTNSGNGKPGWGGGDGQGWGQGSGKDLGQIKGGGTGGLGDGAGPVGRIRGGAPAVASSKMSIQQFSDEGSGRTKAEIQRVIRMRMGGLKYLMTKYSRAETMPDCLMTVGFVIAPDGSVLSAKNTNSTCNSAGFEAEVIQKVKDWNFGPAPKAGQVSTTVGLAFNSN